MFRFINSLFLSLVLCNVSFAMIDEDEDELIFTFDQKECNSSLFEEEEGPEFLDTSNYFYDKKDIFSAVKNIWFLSCCLEFFRLTPGEEYIQAMAKGVTYGNFSQVREVLEKNQDIKFDWFSYAQDAFDNGYKKMGQFIIDYKPFKKEQNKLKKQLKKKDNGKLKNDEISVLEAKLAEQDERLDAIDLQIFKINYKKILTAYRENQDVENDILPWEIFEILADPRIDNNLEGLEHTVLYYLITQYRKHQDSELKSYWTRNLWACLNDKILLKNINSIMLNDEGDIFDDNNIDYFNTERQSLLKHFIQVHPSAISKWKDVENSFYNLDPTGLAPADFAIANSLDEMVIPLQNDFLSQIFDAKKLFAILASDAVVATFH